MYPFGISFDNVVHIFWTADFPTIIHPLTAILTTCIYDKHVHSWIEFVNIQSERGMCRIDAVDVQSWCDLLRRDEAGFPDFEDIDLPPSSFMWNQQSKWEAMESFLQQSQIVSSCYCVVWKWKKTQAAEIILVFINTAVVKIIQQQKPKNQWDDICQKSNIKLAKLSNRRNISQVHFANIHLGNKVGTLLVMVITGGLVWSNFTPNWNRSGNSFRGVFNIISTYDHRKR